MSAPKAWRILKIKYAGDPLSGLGAQITGGRWNEKSTPAVYAAENLALSTLEVFVHTGWEFMHVQLVRVGIHWPDSLKIDSLKGPLPATWDQVPHGPATMALGNAWILSGKAAILKIPSAIIPTGVNFLFNPAHPDFAKIKADKPQPFTWNKRMWKEEDS